MLALTKKTEYALIALTHLFRCQDGVVSAREIARESRVALPTITNILKRLTNAGFVTSERGACGGYGLSKSLQEISLHELITTIEGPFQFVQCTPHDRTWTTDACNLESSCPIRLPAQRIHEKLEAFLKNVSLAEIADGSGACEATVGISAAPYSPQSDME